MGSLSGTTSLDGSACFCGALAGLSKSSFSEGREPLSRKDLEPAASVFPHDKDMPAAIAKELRAETNADERECAIAGVASVGVAVLLGAADGFGFSDSECNLLKIALRRELRQLGVAVGAPDVRESKGRGLRPCNPFELVLQWCASPRVPAYSFGVHLALGVGVLAVPNKNLSDLAWIFRLLSHRSNIKAAKDAPMLHATCNALCGASAEDMSAQLREAMRLGQEQNRRATMESYSVSTEHEAASDGVAVGDLLPSTSSALF